MNQKFASVETLTKALGISKKQARQIREIVKNPTSVSVIRKALKGDWAVAVSPERLAEMQMDQMNEILDLHEVETIHLEGREYIGESGYFNRYYWNDSVLLYTNTGKTYQPTIGYEVRTGKFILLPGGWGSWYENNVEINPET